jgi:pre-mRNA-splicing factor 38B
MKSLTMRVTFKQMEVMLKHKDSPYIRCLGFLYLRYYCEPKSLFEYFEPYLDDMEEFTVAIGQKAKTCVPYHIRTVSLNFLRVLTSFMPMLHPTAELLVNGAASY